jgi:Fic family protein
MAFNWQQAEWPNFEFDLSLLEDKLYLFTEKTGLVSGIIKTLPEDTRIEAIIEIMVAEAIKTSEIEGEFLNRKDVMSSIKRALGLISKDEKINDKRSIGIGELMIDVRETFKSPLTRELLFEWHRMLLPESKGILVGAWRDHVEPMQVISGPMGKEVVHFEAPPSAKVPLEMDRFIDWFNSTGPGGKYEIKKAPVRSAIAHLYFESIHPFEDGNGRIGRMIAEKALSQGMGRPALLSLSKTIELKRSAYYDALKAGQSTLNITPWINYFVDVTLQAQLFAEEQIDFTLSKTKFFDKYNGKLNERQLKLVRKVFDEGPKGFEGGINTSKYVSITKSPKATATRDLQDLLTKGAIEHLGTGGGRSTKYRLNIDFDERLKRSDKETFVEHLRTAIRDQESSARMQKERKQDQKNDDLGERPDPPSYSR